MSDVRNGVNKQTGSLAPIQNKDRAIGWGPYPMLWLRECISIGTLAMGSAQLDKGLNLIQAFLAVLIGSIILVIGICANDRFSYKSDAPYAVQLKNAYDAKGNVTPVIIRGLPVAVWYGFQTQLGGSAISQISIAIFGYDNVVLFFLLFRVTRTILPVKGFYGIRWVENIGDVVVTSIMLYMLFICVTQYWGVIGDGLIDREGSWGMPFIAVIIAFFGNSIMVMLSAGDYSRKLKDSFSIGKRGAAYFITVVPTTVLLGPTNVMTSTATGIASPINVFSQMVHNKVLLVAAPRFVLFAQMITNLANNVVPPACTFMDTFKMKHRMTMVPVGVLAVCTCPWILTNDSSTAGLNLFVKIYTAFFDPIFAVLIMDYYTLYRGKMEETALDDLHNDNGTHSGVNWAAIIAMAVGAVIGLVDVDISFFTTTVPIGLVYYFCMKYMPPCQCFRKGASLEKQVGGKAYV